MKVLALISAAMMASSVSAYRIDVWDNDNYQGTQRSYTTAGSHSLPFALNSWIWSSAVGDGCCVVFCKNYSNVGKYCGSASKAVSSAGANKVVTGCGSAVLNC